MKTRIALLFIIFIGKVYSNISMPSFFSDHMVLQRNSKVKIWGWANPQEEITIKLSWSNVEYKTKASNYAQWNIEIPTLKEGGPHRIILKGSNEIILNDIMFGEVWLCSGQSNMEMSASWGIKNGDEEVQKAMHPNIRFFSVQKQTSIYPQDNLLGKWEQCSPETMIHFSAVAYFFAVRLREELKNVPIGLINASWGGSPAEVWMDEETIKKDKFLTEAAEILRENEWSPIETASVYNAMIYPLKGYEIAGVIWYQGESNVGSNVYDKTLTALITSWRQAWSLEFPFYFVQIAPYKDESNLYASVIIRNAQRKVLLNTNKTGMVVVSDVGDIEDIHPKDKKSVGFRLANLALLDTYKMGLNLANGPLFKEIKIIDDKVFVLFDYEEGLHFKNKKNNQFEIAGEDNIFYTADVYIQKNQVVVYSKNVKHPVKVRFAWKNHAEAELFNKANLPASSFISD